MPPTRYELEMRNPPKQPSIQAQVLALVARVNALKRELRPKTRKDVLKAYGVVPTPPPRKQVLKAYRTK